MFKKLIEKRNNLKAQLDEILSKVKAEERAINDEESAEFDRIEKEIKQIDATIEREERAQNFKVVTNPAGDDANNGTPAVEERAKADENAFVGFLNGTVTEMRAGEQNVTMSNNAKIIPTSISNRVIDAISDICPILAGAEVYHVKGNLRIPKYTKADGHDINVAYAEEFVELTADAGKFDTVDLGGHLVGGLVLIGKSVINNAGIDVTSFIVNKISEDDSIFIEKELLKGTSGKSEGALSTKNIVTTATAGAITYDDLVALQCAVKQAYQKKACWTMHPTTFKAIKLLKDENGRSLLEPDASKEFPFMLLGKPVYLSDNMDAVAGNKLAILYGDYSGLSVNFREDIGIEVIREAYHTRHAIGIDTWFEFDSKVTNEQKLAVLKVKNS